jgi:hypothetical protein
MKIDKIVDSKEHIYGMIYIITNTINNKKYIGQTLSHRKNHNRYRPFGYIRRFKDHISEALCNTKKNQCTYLNQAIRKYGKDVFIVELIETCPIELLDEKEIYQISNHNSLYPNGYNLTIGGKNFYTTKFIVTDNNISINNKKEAIESCKTHSILTKTKISEGIKNFYETNPDKKKELSKRVQQQHYNNKIQIGLNYTIDETNIDQYISIRKTNVTVIFERKRNGKKVKFNKACYENIEDTFNRAKNYLYDVIQYKNKFLQHRQIAGNP